MRGLVQDPRLDRLQNHVPGRYLSQDLLYSRASQHDVGVYLRVARLPVQLRVPDPDPVLVGPQGRQHGRRLGHDATGG